MAPLSTRARFVWRLLAARARRRPLILSHLATGRCNAGCRTCLWRDGGADELAADEVLWLYGQAGAAGMAELVVWGGEPLLRPDLPRLLGAARRAGLSTTLITNGWLAGERWPELRGLVDALILSLDDVGRAHDELRGLPGLYDRLEAFVAALDRDPARPALMVNTVLSGLNPGALRRVAPVARRWRAGLYLCPMETGQLQSFGFVSTHGDLAPPADELRRAAHLALLLKEAGYPVLATREYLELLARDPSVSRYRCRAPHAVLTVGPDGSVRDCLRHDVPLADVRRLRAGGGRLIEVLDSPRQRERLAAAGGCTSCNNPDVVELSWLWDLRPAMLRKVVELAAL